MSGTIMQSLTFITFIVSKNIATFLAFLAVWPNTDHYTDSHKAVNLRLTLCRSQAVSNGHSMSQRPCTMVAGMWRTLSTLSKSCVSDSKNPPLMTKWLKSRWEEKENQTVVGIIHLSTKTLSGVFKACTQNKYSDESPIRHLHYILNVICQCPLEHNSVQ